ncbi:hypothetical protein N2603_03010 [Bradyrhizobium huanghuaihaiense]|uniref:hypothetical protein n=1 Tax=Bradyrhizobium huanghuaihaiense TaxID=990078 RepID=UPI0021AA2538|nr:hypothetical protein [Bradyrhizobium sp. CB3035]UWU77459.1 hypothetical protein N2603_03010 [Bradyrhizobium sp. CB3035]
MSDGPHRTLPMRRHWKDTAERAAKFVYSEGDCREALELAIKREILGAPISAVGEILDARRPDLFQTHQVEQLEDLRGTCRGSAMANVLIDCAVEAARNGLRGRSAVQSTLQNAINDVVLSAYRQMNEHYQREAKPREVLNLRTRLDAVRRQLDGGALASEILSHSTPPSARSLQLPRHTGLDDGPERP